MRTSEVREVSEPPGPAPDAEIPPPAPVRRNPIHRRAWLTLAIVVGAGLLSIMIYLIATRGQQTTDDAQVEADVVPIGARTGGQVMNVLITEDQKVKKGDLLLKIDDADHAARVLQAQGELAIANAQLQTTIAQEQVVAATARGGLSSARASVSGSTDAVLGAGAQIDGARAVLERASAEAKKAEIDLERAKGLRSDEAIPQERLDAVQTAYEAAHAALVQARAGLAAAEDQKRVAESRVTEARGKLTQSAPIEAEMAVASAQTELARARVKSAEATLVLANNQLSYTNVVAPERGVVSKLAVHVGQLLSPGQPVAELVPDRTYVLANFKETQIEGMRPGDRAIVRIDAYPHRKLEAKVESLSGGTGARFSMLPADNASGNFVKVVQRVPVRIAWLNPPGDLPLRAGLSADVTVDVGTVGAAR